MLDGVVKVGVLSCAGPREERWAGLMVILACLGTGWPLRISTVLRFAGSDGVCKARMYAEGERDMVTLVGLEEM